MILDRKQTGLQRVAFLVLNWLFEHVMMDKDTSKSIRKHWVKDPLANMIRIMSWVNLNEKKWSLLKLYRPQEASSLKPLSFATSIAFWKGKNDWQAVTCVTVSVTSFGYRICVISFYR